MRSLKVERYIEEDQKKIRENQKKAVLAAGGEWSIRQNGLRGNKKRREKRRMEKARNKKKAGEKKNGKSKK